MFFCFLTFIFCYWILNWYVNFLFVICTCWYKPTFFVLFYAIFTFRLHIDCVAFILYFEDSVIFVVTRIVQKINNVTRLTYQILILRTYYYRLIPKFLDGSGKWKLNSPTSEFVRTSRLDRYCIESRCCLTPNLMQRPLCYKPMKQSNFSKRLLLKI